MTLGLRLAGCGENESAEAIRRLPEKEAPEMSELETTPQLPDNTPIREVQFPTRIKNALFAAGLKTVGEAREMSDTALLSLPDFGKISVAQLRETLGPPSTDGVRPSGKKHG